MIMGKPVNQITDPTHYDLLMNAPPGCNMKGVKGGAWF
jgi:hypothetical protein